MSQPNGYTEAILIKYRRKFLEVNNNSIKSNKHDNVAFSN